MKTLDQLWLGYAVIAHIAVEAIVILTAGVMLAEAFDSTLLGLIALVVVYFTPLQIVLLPFVLIGKVIVVGIPTAILTTLGLLTENISE